MAGGFQDDDDDIITNINVTPLVDIILVLLIIFMVTSEIIHDRERPSVIPLQLPTAASAEEVLSRGLLNLVIDKDGQLYVNGDKTDYPTVQDLVRSVQMRNIEPKALISADERVTHGQVAALMDFLRLNDVTSISINTKRQAIE